MIRYAYYPGCALQTVARDYDTSLRAVSRLLGFELVVLEGWNCCGAMSLPTANYLLSLALPARNLALVEEIGLPLVVACGTCLNTLRRSRHACNQRPEWRSRVQAALHRAGRTYRGEVEIGHALEVLAGPLALAKLRRQVRHPLKGLRVAVYYGCQLSGPGVQGLTPSSYLEELMTGSGAELVNISQKARCCGNNLVSTRPDEALPLVQEILNEAMTKGAQYLAVACPMCRHNLLAAQKCTAGCTPIPLRIAYFSELLAEALGVT